MSSIIKLGKKRLRFKTSFDQFTLADIKAWWKGAKVIEGLYSKREEIAKKYEEIEALVDQFSSEEIEDKFTNLEADSDVLRSDLTMAYIDMLCVLAITKDCREFMEETDGLTHEAIMLCLEVLQKRLGDFVEYFESCPPVEKFKHVGKGWYPRSYKVHPMENNTLMRDALASVQIATALDFSNEIGAGRWDNIVTFVSLVTRPKGQSLEMAFSKDAFIHSRELKGMDSSDKAQYYQQVLDKSVKGREKHFKNLLLPIAIGVIKEYEKKKQRSMTDGIKYSKDQVQKKQSNQKTILKDSA